MSKKRVIGVLGHKHSGTFQPGYGQNEKYIEFFRQFGDVIIIDAQSDNVFPVDLLVLPGGADVNPLRYGEKPHITTQKPDLEYEWFMVNTFEKYVERAQQGKTAIYGICAGFQNLNVFFGGKINQDIHQIQSESYRRGELVDDLILVGPQNFLQGHSKYNNSWLHPNKNHSNGVKTNSIHHQGVYDNKFSKVEKETISANFDTLAYNKIFGNVEVFLHKTLPIAGEQAHPEERDYPLYTIVLIETLLEQVNKFN